MSRVDVAQGTARDWLLQKRAPAPTPVKPKPKPPPVKPTVPVLTTTILTPPIDTTSTTTTTSLQSTVPSSGAGASEGDIQKSQGSNVGLIAGVVAGVLVLLAIIAGLVFRRKRRQGQAVREAEMYQQQTMMYNSADRTSAEARSGPAQGLHIQAGSNEENAYRQQQRQLQLSKQPEWWARKSPLEYYRQVPPLADLQRDPSLGHPRSQDLGIASSTHLISSSPYVSQEAIASRGLAQEENSQGVEAIPLHPTNSDFHQHHPRGHNKNNIAMQSSLAMSRGQVPAPVRTHPYLPPQDQFPRPGNFHPYGPGGAPLPGQISPIRPASPMGSQYSVASTISSAPPPSVPPLPSQGPSGSPSIHPYHPPPPPPSATATKTAHQPSPGFYDFLDVNADGQEEKINTFPLTPSNVSSIPPPIPHATRPVSSLPSSSTAALVRQEGTRTSPMPTPLSLSLDKALTSSSSTTPWMAATAPGPADPMSPRSPTSPTQSEFSVTSDGAPRIGGRRPRVKAKKGPPGPGSS